MLDKYLYSVPVNMVFLVFKKSSRHVLKTFSRHAFKTSSRHLQRHSFFSSKTYWRRLARCLEEVLKTSWRRLQHVLKTSWKTKNSYAEDIFKMSWRPTNTCWGGISQWCTVGSTKSISLNGNLPLHTDSKFLTFCIYFWMNVINHTVKLFWTHE